MKQESCNFCQPQIGEVVHDIPMTLDEMVVLRNGIEVLGKALKCGDCRLNCEPLKLIQRQINKLKP